MRKFQITKKEKQWAIALIGSGLVLYIINEPIKSFLDKLILGISPSSRLVLGGGL